MIIKRKQDFIGVLENIANEANKKYPNQKGVGMEIVYKPNSVKNMKAEIFFGWDDCDYLHVNCYNDGRMQNDDDYREYFSEELLKERLIDEINELLEENIPGTKEKLEYIKRSIENLKTKVF